MPSTNQGVKTLFNGTENGSFFANVSNSTKAKPPKIKYWTASMEARLKKLFVRENRTIFAIARMMKAREYEIADKLREMNIPTEQIVIKPRPSPMKGHTRKDYVPKWMKKIEDELPLEFQTVEASEPVVYTPKPKEVVDPRVTVLELFMEERERFKKQIINLKKVDIEKLNSQDRVHHDIAYAKAVTMHDWFSRNYDLLISGLAGSPIGATSWTPES
jgi:hypothetical protein